eukprot:COSAG01_NODE_4733_length_4785_cov_130.591763_1_plen_175_part_00
MRLADLGSVCLAHVHCAWCTHMEYTGAGHNSYPWYILTITFVIFSNLLTRLTEITKTPETTPAGERRQCSLPALRGARMCWRRSGAHGALCSLVAAVCLMRIGTPCTEPAYPVCAALVAPCARSYMGCGNCAEPRLLRAGGRRWRRSHSDTCRWKVRRGCSDDFRAGRGMRPGQ